MIFFGKMFDFFAKFYDFCSKMCLRSSLLMLLTFFFVESWESIGIFSYGFTIPRRDPDRRPCVQASNILFSQPCQIYRNLPRHQKNNCSMFIIDFKKSFVGDVIMFEEWCRNNRITKRLWIFN